MCIDVCFYASECCVGVHGYRLFGLGPYSGKAAEREAERRKGALFRSR